MRYEIVRNPNAERNAVYLRSYWDPPPRALYDVVEYENPKHAGRVLAPGLPYENASKIANALRVYVEGKR